MLAEKGCAMADAPLGGTPVQAEAGQLAAMVGVLVVAALGLALPLPLGVIGHEGSTVLVCLNGLRLLFIARR